MARVELNNVYKIYPGRVTAVKDACLVIEDQEFMVLVGPSGCGKSTTLRMIAGLEEISKGTIIIDGKKVNDIPPKDRDIAMVFQNYALYPHMSVEKNMAFGLKLRRYPRAEIETRVREAAEILSIDSLLGRKPKELSGGQRQRVAVGRAIVRKPKVFLFDEPLSNLDAKMRVQMRMEISKLHTRLAATMIYVTHDQIEAMTMGDRICVMKDGVIQQVAEPLTLYNRPANQFVAGFIGSPQMNFFSGQLEERNGSLVFCEGMFSVKIDEQKAMELKAWIGRKVVLGIRPEDISDALYVPQPNPDHLVHATVEVLEPMGAETFIYMTTGKHALVAKMQRAQNAKPNQVLKLVFNMNKGHFFDAETGDVL